MDKAKYAFGLDYTIFTALNPDFTMPTPKNIIGGAGPFTFGAEDNSGKNVPLIVVVDGTKTELEVDFSEASAWPVVTGAEAIAALNTKLSGVDITASVDMQNDSRLKFVHDTAGSVAIYGRAAEVIGLGQGFGIRPLVSDTMESLEGDPVYKDSERISVVDAWGKETEIITESKKKGHDLVITDTSEDWDIYKLVNGIKGSDDEWDDDTTETKRPVVCIEAYSRVYAEGQNQEADIRGYLRETYPYVIGSSGGKSRNRGFATSAFNMSATSRTAKDGTIVSSKKFKLYTPEQFAALKLDIL